VAPQSPTNPLGAVIVIVLMAAVLLVAWALSATDPIPTRSVFEAPLPVVTGAAPAPTVLT